MIRPQRTQAWSFCLHVLCKRPSREGPRGQPWYQVRYVLTWICVPLLGATVLMNITGDVGKMLGEQWKSLTDKEKTPYEAKAAADKKRYEEEKAAYTAVCH